MEIVMSYDLLLIHRPSYSEGNKVPASELLAGPVSPSSMPSDVLLMRSESELPLVFVTFLTRGDLCEWPGGG